MSNPFPLRLCALSGVLFAGACATHPAGESGAPSAAPVASVAPVARAKAVNPDRVTVTDAQGNIVVQKVEFRPGVSSATVERLARQAGCSGDIGAGLVTEPGPVEVYRMQCRDGSVFMARCELRQCKPMR